MRGDANIDFIMSLMIFLGFITFVLVSLNQIVITQTPKQELLEYQEYLVSGMLLKKLSYDGRLNILDQSVLDSVVNCDQLDLGVTTHIYYEVSTRSKTWKCTPSENPSTAMPYIQRPVYVKLKNGRETPGILKVWAWGEVT